MILIPSVRLATPADARGIAEMSREYIEHGLGWSWTRERVLKAIRDPSTNVAVVQQEDHLLGFGIMQYGEQRAHLSLLGIELIHRKRGLATLLLAWLEKSAIVAGIERIQLEARSDNVTALAFYCKQGYQQTGTIVGYYRGVLDAVRLEKQLGGEPAGELGS
jgi:[ribosomal protein S18]-alanine N-acetyltransferase